MATNAYMLGRQKYGRPQGLLFADNPGTTRTITDDNGTELIAHFPEGYEVGADTPLDAPSGELDQFIIVSDHNRSAIDLGYNRLEKRERMINGRMRSYHIADKLELSISWDMLPSRAFKSEANFNSGGKVVHATADQYTADGGAGGVELLDWYLKHPDSFWVYLAYDNYKNFNATDDQFSQLGQYSQVIEMHISNFDYSVVKRGVGTHDFWNISISLEEV